MEKSQQAQVICEWEYVSDQMIQKYREWQSSNAEASIDTFKSEMSKLVSLKEQADALKQDATKAQLQEVLVNLQK